MAHIGRKLGALLFHFSTQAVILLQHLRKGDQLRIGHGLLGKGIHIFGNALQRLHDLAAHGGAEPQSGHGHHDQDHADHGQHGIVNGLGAGGVMRKAQNTAIGKG